MDSSVLDDLKTASAALRDLPKPPRLIEVPSLDVFPEPLRTQSSGLVPMHLLAVPVILNEELVYAITDHRGVRTVYVPDNLFGDIAAGPPSRWKRLRSRLRAGRVA